MKHYLKILLAITAFVCLKSFTGCGGSEEVVEDETTKRIKDSTKIYQTLESARLSYTKAIQLNEQADSKSSEEFESAVKQLSKIDNGALDKHPAWKKDYEQLGTAVVQDYVTAVSDIDEKSKVFSLAKRLNVNIDKVEHKSYSHTFDPKDLPTGEDIKLERNEAVDNYINYFTNGGKKYMDKWLYRSGKYYNLLRSILRENNAPEELVYLATIESGLDPSISSHAGAIGMWQFMPTTGSAYGLYYDSNTDDKRDIEKATDAAARHLKDLYKMFGDWYLAMASYNAGPGRITNAIKKSGSNNFWTIRNYLPKETQNYVPQFIATGLIALDPKGFGFNDVEYGNPIQYDRAIIKSSISISRIAELCGSDVETIRELNSQMLSDVTPVFEDGYLIKIPKGKFKEFAKNYDNADDIEKYGFKAQYDGNDGTATHNSSESFTHFKVSGYEVEDKNKIICMCNRELVKHKVADKEDLMTIAPKYSVRPNDLRIWNNLSYGKYPKTGDEISVWITKAKFNELNGIKEEPKKEDEGNNYNNTEENNTAENNEKGTPLVNKEHSGEDTGNEKKEPEVKEKKEKPVVVKEKKEKKSGAQTYVVKEGDNLTAIADAYNVSVSDIREWNNIEGDKIYSGQKLKLYSDVKNTAGNKKKTNTTYKVKEGDNLTAIASEFNVTVAQIKDWNDLETDVIHEGQVLKLYSSKKTTEKKITKAKTYTVKSGDNLTMIADKFSVSVSDIKKWNGLDDDVIQEGQVLKLSGSKETTKKETKKKTEYYTVKKGDTLAKIADKYDVSIRDLKGWNNIKGDDIVIGQKLIVSK